MAGWLAARQDGEYLLKSYEHLEHNADDESRQQWHARGRRSR